MPVTVCLIALLVIAPQRGADKPDPREQLDTAIAEGIRLLEAKDHKTFLSTFVIPEALQKQGGAETFAPRFAARADRLLAALKEVQKAKPVMDADGTRATYTLQPGDGPSTLAFQKIGRYWFIAN